MDSVQLQQLLQSVKNGSMEVEKAEKQLRELPYKDIGHTKIDSHRALRSGFFEVIYAQGKTPQQVTDIISRMKGQSNILATRVSTEMAAFVLARIPELSFNEQAGTLTHISRQIDYLKARVAIITAGTSDLSVAEEARITAEMLGCRAEIISDVGVAGMHRLFDKMEEIGNASVLIVVAGMEGALASVVGGLTSQPIIAVPTSVGYGANFQGLSALLGMLTSCASGVTVVNIDNGFGAACAAFKICRLAE